MRYHCLLLFTLVAGCTANSHLTNLWNAGAACNVNASYGGPSDVIFGYHDRVVNDESFRALLPDLLALPNFQMLRLAGMDVTDDSIPVLLRLHSLRHLDLRATRITADGMERLQALPHLQMLIVDDSNISEDKVLRLRSAIPRVEVVVRPYPEWIDYPVPKRFASPATQH